MDINDLQHQCFEKFKKSDALSFLKEISQSLSKEEFLELSNRAMLDAYRANRVKAVEYMLSFYEKDNPELLMIIHLQRMLIDEKDFEKGKKMLVPLAKHFSTETCQKIMTNFIGKNGKNSEQMERQREKEINKIILEETLQTSQVQVKRPKI